MANKYLISAMVNDVETFYTASPNGSITSIGDRIDWSKGFDDYTLSCIDNSVYSTLKNGKVWVNSNAVMASEETTGESYVYTTDQTAIDCSGYSGLSSLVFNFNGTISENQKTLIKAAISFNGRKAYYTRGNGYIAANSTAIPTTAAGRTTAGINIDENNFAVLFDGDLNNTMFSTKDSSVIVPVEFTNGLVARKYDITIPPSCRLPLISTFQVYDSETSSWKTLDTIIIKASKTISRYFDNEINGTTYRWVFNADPTDLGDDPTRSIDITELNVYGRTTGTVWLLLDNPEEVKTRGLSLAELEALTLADFNQIFDQTQIDFVIYVPKKFNDGVSLSGITANFPANGAPMIDYFRAITNKIHAGDCIKDITGEVSVAVPRFSNYDAENKEWVDFDENNIITGEIEITPIVRDEIICTGKGKDVLKVPKLFAFDTVLKKKNDAEELESVYTFPKGKDVDDYSYTGTYDVSERDEAEISCSGIHNEDPDLDQQFEVIGKQWSDINGSLLVVYEVPSTDIECEKWDEGAYFKDVDFYVLGDYEHRKDKVDENDNPNIITCDKTVVDGVHVKYTDANMYVIKGVDDYINGDITVRGAILAYINSDDFKVSNKLDYTWINGGTAGLKVAGKANDTWINGNIDVREMISGTIDGTITVEPSGSHSYAYIF